MMASPADARIVCKGNFQLVAGNMITTPYCRDKNLARVARASGFKVNDNAILYNPNAKRDVCRYLISNIEVQMACLEVQGRYGPDF